MTGILKARPRPAAVGGKRRRPRVPAAVLVGAAPFCLFWLLADVDDASRITGAATLGLSALLCGAVARTARPQAAVAWSVTAVGIAIQLRLGAGLETMMGFVATAAILFLLTAAVARRVARHYYTARKLAVTGQAALAAALVLRLVPALQGHVNSGQVVLGPVSVQLGEFSRVLAILGVGLVAWSTLGSAGLRQLIRGEAKAGTAGLFLLGGNLALLVVVDTGPAIVLATASLVMGLLSVARLRPILRRMQLWLTAAAVVFLGISFAGQFDVLNRLEARWSNVSVPDEQLAAALRAAQGGGLVGHGIGTSPLARHIPVAASDFVPSVVAADLGYLSLGLLTAALLCTYGAMLRRTSRSRTPLAITAAGMLTALLVQTAITVLGSMGAIPLTGLSTPLLAANGSTMLSTFIALGVAAAAIDEGNATAPMADTRTPLTPPRAVVGLSAGIVAYLCALAVLPIDTSHQGLYLPRGDVSTGDGMVIATTDDAGSRIYPHGDLFADLGHLAPGYGDYGLESMYRTELTCGGPASALDVVLSLFRQPACVPADIETTLHGPLQQALKEAAGPSTAQVVVSDSADGSIVGLYSSGQVNPADLEAGTAPTAPSRLSTSPPGSTYKLVVAAAALLNDVDLTGIPLDVLTADGAKLTNSGHFECPDTSIPTMLAYSCNTTAGALSLRLGQAELNRVAEEYFGANSWTRFDGGSVAPMSMAQPGAVLSAPQLMRTGIGQESVQSSPLAMNAATAVIARSALQDYDGGIPALHLVAGVCGPSGLLQTAPSGTFGKPLPRPVAAEILGGMHRATGEGTARRLGSAGRSLGRDVAAKSGTAEVHIPGSGSGVDTWITAIVDGRWVITARVQNSSPSDANNATEIAARILPHIPSSNIPNKTPCS